MGCSLGFVVIFGKKKRKLFPQRQRKSVFLSQASTSSLFAPKLIFFGGRVSDDLSSPVALRWTVCGANWRKLVQIGAIWRNLDAHTSLSSSFLVYLQNERLFCIAFFSFAGRQSTICRRKTVVGPESVVCGVKERAKTNKRRARAQKRRFTAVEIAQTSKRAQRINTSGPLWGAQVDASSALRQSLLPADCLFFPQTVSSGRKGAQMAANWR